MIERCEDCKFHFKRLETLGDGTTLPAEICVIGKMPDDDCRDFEKKWMKKREFRHLRKHLKGTLGNENG